MVECPICQKPVQESAINEHLDSGCQLGLVTENADIAPSNVKAAGSSGVSSFFQPSSVATARTTPAKPQPPARIEPTIRKSPPQFPVQAQNGVKRKPEADEARSSASTGTTNHGDGGADYPPTPKRTKVNHLHGSAPLAERMRPRTLDDVCGQDLVGPHGMIRGLIEQDRVPSMILWGGSGTGKTTIARLIAHTAGCRFVEINSTSSGVNECKKLFAEARGELALTGRKTILFCDEIHRFSKSQQDVFLGPVETGQITLIGATTENPSFKVVGALLSRCRTFTLDKLSDESVITIMSRALAAECDPRPSLLDDNLLTYLAKFSDGDARTALNLLELAIDLSQRSDTTTESIKTSLTHTMVYDRAGDQHYNTISAFHKSIRGSDPDASLYYLARMLQSGEDPLYIARRLIVVASEDVGLADNSMLPLAIACHTSVEKVGLPEARISLAHATVALARAPKSTMVYRALSAAMALLAEPGVAGLEIPLHLRNAPTGLMRELGYGKEYKYNPDYVEGRVVQEYFPEQIRASRFLEDRHLGTKVDADLVPDLPGPAAELGKQTPA